MLYFDYRILPFTLVAYKPLLEAVIRGETTHGAHVEKLKNYEIYSVRINNKGRILFTFQDIQGIRSLVVLEVLENHEYDKSKFLKKNVLKKYLNQNKAELETRVQDADFESVKLEENIPEKTRTISSLMDIQPAFENHQGYIILDAEQEGVLSAQTPMIVEGPPGSGKTSLAEGLVKQALAQNHSVLVVTRSERLARKIKQELSVTPEYDAHQVNILAYKDLDPDLREGGKALFEDWFANFLQEKIKDKNTAAKYADKIPEVYEEFRILSGYPHKDYISAEGLGKKQNRFSDPKDRQWLAIVYQAWLKYLKDHQIKLADFSELNPDDFRKYDLIVLDEAQDLSHLQLKNLAKLAPKGNIAISIDRRQNIEDENPKIIYLKKMLTEICHQEPVVIELSTHYRCPQGIMNFAQVFNELRLQFSPKLKTEPKIAQSPNTDGAVYWVEPNAIQIRQDDPNTCIIVQEDSLKAEARDKLGISQVFTPDEIKGFEYETVILYKLLDRDKLYELNQCLDPNAKHKPEVDKLNASAALSTCFVAATRPTKNLYIIQNSKQHNLKFLIQILKEKLPANSPEPVFVQEPSVDVLALKWEQRAKEAIERGQVQEARRILEQQLKIADIAFVDKKIQEWQQDLGIASAPEVASPKIPEPTLKKPIVKQNQKKSPEPKKPAVTAAVPKKLIPPKVAVPTEKEVAAFLRAADLGKLDVVEKFIQNYKSNVDIYSKRGQFTALCFASIKGHKDIIQALIAAGANINHQDEYGNTPLLLAISKWHLESFKVLLNAGANCQLMPRSDNLNAFMIAVRRFRKGFLEPLLNKYGINYLFYNHATVLHYAISSDLKDQVTMLLQYPNIDLNIQDQEGNTPLHLAVQKGKIDFVEMLLKDPKINVNLKNDNLKDDTSQTPLEIAVDANNIELVKLLLKVKHDFDSLDGDSPLHQAVTLGHTEIVELLLNAGLDGTQKTEWGGDSVFHLAADQNDLKTLQLLISKGLDLNMQNSEGQTALFSSVFKKNKEILKALLEAGADITLVDEEGMTVLDYAREKNLPDIIALLEEANLRIKSGQSNKKIETLVSELESLKLSSEKSEALVSSSESSVLNQWKHFTLEDANLSVVPESDLEHRFDSSSRLGVLKPKVG
jgi:ankyrin repeat protein